MRGGLAWRRRRDRPEPPPPRRPSDPTRPNVPAASELPRTPIGVGPKAAKQIYGEARAAAVAGKRRRYCARRPLLRSCRARKKACFIMILQAIWLFKGRFALKGGASDKLAQMRVRRR